MTGSSKNKILIFLLTMIILIFISVSAVDCTKKVKRYDDSTYTVTDEYPGDRGAVEDNYLFEEEPYIYSEEEIDYFFETVLGSEFGASEPLIHKWTDDIRINVNGIPTAEDLNTLGQVISELNDLVDDISLVLVDGRPNIEIYFTTVESFASIEPNYVPGNMGFFWIYWDSNKALYSGRILIASEEISQQERSHIIREELTQSLGIMNDSYSYEDSIFYQGWTDTLSYAPIDRTVISLLYDPGLLPGMTREEVEGVLSLK
jgi:hypothetical protein